jgi:hypothetical protein
MTAKKHCRDRLKALGAERTKAADIETLNEIDARLDEVTQLLAVLNWRSDKSARTAEDHTA